MLRRVGLAVAGGTAYAGAVFGGYMYTKYGGDGGGGGCGCGCDDAAARRAREAALPSAAYRQATYDAIAPRYDGMLGWDETVLGIGLMRRCLLACACGDVLELAAGTGRNLEFYDRARVTSLLQTDASAPMLEVAARRARDAAARAPLATAVARADGTALTAGGGAAGGRRWDTVVDTFGLCSFDEPVEALREMQRCCAADGLVLLLEHGRSHSQPWLSRVLDAGAQAHAAKWGCVYNRDIDAIVAESGLRVLRRHTFHFGTTYAIVGAPAPEFTTSATRSHGSVARAAPGWRRVLGGWR